MTKEQFKKLEVIALSKNEEDKVICLELLNNFIGCNPVFFRYLYNCCIPVVNDVLHAKIVKYADLCMDLTIDIYPMPINITFGGNIDSEEYEIKQRKLAEVCLSRGNI